MLFRVPQQLPKLIMKMGQPWIWIRKRRNRPKLKTGQPWIWIWKRPKLNLKTENGRFIRHGDLCLSKFILDGAWIPIATIYSKTMVGSCGSDRQAVGSVPRTCRIRTIFMVRSAARAIRLSTSGVHLGRISKGSTIPMWRSSSDRIRGF